MEECTTIQKLRKPKILNMSIFDWITSLLGAILVGYFMGLKTTVSWLLFIFLWIILGVITHWLFGVNTQFGFYLGLNPKPDRKGPCT